MKVVDGRWVTDDDNPVDLFNYDEFKEIKEKVSLMYGENITHDRITIISKIQNLNESQEKALAVLLSDDELFSKLASL